MLLLINYKKKSIQLIQKEKFFLIFKVLMIRKWILLHFGKFYNFSKKILKIFNKMILIQYIIEKCFYKSLIFSKFISKNSNFKIIVIIIIIIRYYNHLC